MRDGRGGPVRRVERKLRSPQWKLHSMGWLWSAGVAQFVEWSADCAHRNGNSTRWVAAGGRGGPVRPVERGLRLPQWKLHSAARPLWTPQRRRPSDQTMVQLWRLARDCGAQLAGTRHSRAQSATSKGLSVIGGSREGTGLASVESDRALPKQRFAPRRVDRRGELLIEWSQDCAHRNGDFTRWRPSHTPVSIGRMRACAITVAASTLHFLA